MKAIIFDLDNTLIMWDNSYRKELFNVLKKYNIEDTYNLYNTIDGLIDTYEYHYEKLEKESFLDYINTNALVNLPIEFVDDLIIAQGNCYKDDPILVDVIKYLSSKYDLYVITNWFTYTQSKRLENVGVLKYFKKVMGADVNYEKPNTKCYDYILSMYNPSECVAVGDSLKNDVELPETLGIKGIWLTKEKSDKYTTIKELSELKNIL